MKSPQMIVFSVNTLILWKTDFHCVSTPAAQAACGGKGQHSIFHSRAPFVVPKDTPAEGNISVALSHLGSPFLADNSGLHTYVGSG